MSQNQGSITLEYNTEWTLMPDMAFITKTLQRLNCRRIYFRDNMSLKASAFAKNIIVLSSVIVYAN